MVVQGRPGQKWGRLGRPALPCWRQAQVSKPVSASSSSLPGRSIFMEPLIFEADSLNYPSQKYDPSVLSFLKICDQIILLERQIYRSSQKADFYGTASRSLWKHTKLKLQGETNLKLVKCLDTSFSKLGHPITILMAVLACPVTVRPILPHSS